MSLLYSVTTAAAIDPVSLEDCKYDLRIESTEENDLILTYISAATEFCSEVVGRKLISETIKYSIDCASGTVLLPFKPVSSITEIQYFDTDNVSQTLTISDFYLYNFEDYSAIVPKTDINWPTVYDRRDAINISFVAGYGPAASDVPSAIKKAIRLLVAHWYENREASSVGVTAQEIPFGVQNLLGIDRTGWVG